jgi:hypothetical protein
MASAETSAIPGWTWIPGGNTEGGTEAGYWAQIPGYVAPVTPAPNTVGGSTGPNAAINAAWKPTASTTNQLAELLTNPASGYATLNNYGGRMGRFQFSNTAPVPQDAPVGWGRYPGVDGSPPPPSWLRSNTGTQPPVTVNPPANTVGNTGTGPQWANGGGNQPIVTPAWPNGVTPEQLPQLATGSVIPPQWSTPNPAGVPTGGGGPLGNPTYGGNQGGITPTPGQNYGPMTPGGSATTVDPSSLTSFVNTFRFANPANGQQQAFNQLAAKNPNDAMQFLMQYGWNTSGNDFQAQAAKAGLSGDAISRLINSYSGGGGGSYLPQGYGNTGFSWGGTMAASGIPKTLWRV